MSLLTDQPQAIVLGNHITGRASVDEPNSDVPQSGFDATDRLGDRLASASASWFGTGFGLSFDFGASRSVDLVALINSNLTSAATVAVGGDSTPRVSVAGSAIVASVDCSDLREFHRNAFGFFAPVAYRYWRIEVSDPGNVDGLLRIGELLFAASSWLPKCITVPIQQDKEYRAVRAQTDAENEYSYSLDVESVFSLNIANADDETEREDFEQLIFDTRGGRLPALLIPSTYRNRSYYGKFEGGVRYNWRVGCRTDIQNVRFRELSQGFFAAL